MKIYYSDYRPMKLPEGHTFPAEKYTLLRERIISSPLSTKVALIPSREATRDEIILTHDPDYFDRMENGTLTPKELRRIGFPWSMDLIQRAKCSVGGTIETCRTALKEGISMNLSGGTHHAFCEFGQGFCLLNDSVIAVQVLKAETSLKHILIIDLDVHQGNGTAALLAEDPSVFTFSIHGKNCFPYKKEKSDLDIELLNHINDGTYLNALKKGLSQIKNRFSPDFVIYLAGADPFKDDYYGAFSLSKEGLQRRDQKVLDFAKQNNAPIAITMAGGYAKTISDCVDIHFQTVSLAASYHQSLCRP